MSIDKRSRARSDFERLRRYYREHRSEERLLSHYQLERQLAHQILNALPAERVQTVQAAYARLLNKIPDHPRNVRANNIDDRHTSRSVRLLHPFVRPDTRYLEIGCGDGKVVKAIATDVRAAIGIDVNDALFDLSDARSNVTFMRTGGVEIPLPDRSVDFVFSDQLMEHLHPDDAVAQLREIVRVLSADGKYLCRTPSRLTGPHDVSRYFSYSPEGLHLKEYSVGELAKLFGEAGFSRANACIFAKGHCFQIPTSLAMLLEDTFSLLPRALKSRLAPTAIANVVLGANVLAIR